MPESPCPVWRPGTRRPGQSKDQPGKRLALFMLTPLGQISGAVAEGRVLDQQQAQQLWASWPWLPAIEGQPWPLELPGLEMQEHPMQDLPEPDW